MPRLRHLQWNTAACCTRQTGISRGFRDCGGKIRWSNGNLAAESYPRIICNGILYMVELAVDFYQETDGTAPVEDFLNSLRPEGRAKALALLQSLKTHG